MYCGIPQSLCYYFTESFTVSTFCPLSSWLRVLTSAWAVWWLRVWRRPLSSIHSSERLTGLCWSRGRSDHRSDRALWVHTCTTCVSFLIKWSMAVFKNLISSLFSRKPKGMLITLTRTLHVKSPSWRQWRIASLGRSTKMSSKDSPILEMRPRARRTHWHTYGQLHTYTPPRHTTKHPHTKARYSKKRPLEEDLLDLFNICPPQELNSTNWISPCGSCPLVVCPLVHIPTNCKLKQHVSAGQVL